MLVNSLLKVLLKFGCFVWWLLNILWLKVFVICVCVLFVCVGIVLVSVVVVVFSCGVGLG